MNSSLVNILIFPKIPKIFQKILKDSNLSVKETLLQMLILFGFQMKKIQINFNLKCSGYLWERRRDSHTFY